MGGLMRLLMAISADGFVAKSDQDSMTWLGPLDKHIFRILSAVGGVCGIGRKSMACITTPLPWPGRTLIPLSLHGGTTLTEFYHKYPDAWLLGGQILALQAFELGYLSEVHLCRSTIKIGSGSRELLTSYLRSPCILTVFKSVTDEEPSVVVETYRGTGSIYRIRDPFRRRYYKV